jgi:predicted SnoaL-like aldol condensation-catalyzing enzyme
MKRKFVIMMVASLMLLIGNVLTGCSDDSSTTPELTNTEKAKEVIKALETGDATALEKYVSAETYIQHNPAFPDGRQVLIDAVTSGQLNGTKVDVRRVITDGDIVILHSKYFFFGKKQVGIDLFRFENGVIVEHWDNLQVADGDAVSPKNKNTMLNGTTKIETSENTEANREVVKNLMENIFVNGKWSSYPEYISEKQYIQHNPAYPNGTALFTMFPDGTPFYKELKYVYAENNFVLSMSEGYPDKETGLANAYFDIFRLSKGKIVEHWDTIQAIPAKNNWANNNGKW